MVFYFTCSDERYIIYMGRDKYENEELIKYGWPEDLWFHVDKLSSAHVYLRLPPGETIDDVSSEIVHECAQLTKLNSIEGCKLSHVPVVYTMWSNLRKSGDMAVGQVGFHKRAEVRSVVVEKRINEIVNRLNKTKEEKHNHPAELAELRAARDAREIAENKASLKQACKAHALAKEDERSRLAEERTAAANLAVSSREIVENGWASTEAERERLESSLLKAFAGGLGDSDLTGDLPPEATSSARKEKEDLEDAKAAWRAFDAGVGGRRGEEESDEWEESAPAPTASELAAKAVSPSEWPHGPSSELRGAWGGGSGAAT
ncbi:MAG: hypothetical protein SGPRY_009834 [Prymnesium sp.]